MSGHLMLIKKFFTYEYAAFAIHTLRPQTF